MTLDQEGAAADAAQRAMDRIREDGRDIIWTLRNGIQIRCSAIPMSYLQALRESMPPPGPPLVAGAGGQPEENPDDPTYRKALQDHQEAFEMAATKMVLGLATKLESVPDGMDLPAGDGWVGDVQRSAKFTGKDIPLHLDDPDLRYVDWLRFYACDNETDLATIGWFPTRLGGLTQTEVATAIEAFRDIATRRADNESPPQQPTQLRRPNNRAARRTRS